MSQVKGPKTILVIDDDPGIRSVLRLRLEAAGYAVVEADGGHAGLEAAGRHLPAAIILDVRMIDMYGYEVCSHLRAKRGFERTPIVMLSANGQDAARQLAGDVGATCYITKPFDAADVVRRIEHLLGDRAAISSEEHPCTTRHPRSSSSTTTTASSGR